MSALATQEHLLFTAQTSSLLMRCVAFPNSLLDATPWGSAQMEQLLIPSRLYSVFPRQLPRPPWIQHLSFKNVSICFLRCCETWFEVPENPGQELIPSLCHFYFTNTLTSGRLRVNTISSNKKGHFSESLLFLIDLWGVICQWFGVHLYFLSHTTPSS